MVVTIDDVQYVFQRVCTPFAILINSILIYLILTKSSSSFGAYRYLLIYISLFEMAYAIFDFFISPTHFSYGPIFLVIGPANILTPAVSRTAMSVIHASFCSIFAVSMAVFTLPFIYRYCVVKGGTLLHSFQTWKLLLWISFPMIVGVMCTILVSTTLESNAETDVILEKHFLPSNSMRLEEITYFGPNYYLTDSDGNEYLNLKVSIGMFIIVVMVSSSIMCTIFFGIKCYLTLRETVSTVSNSQHYRSVQIQLLTSLVIQTIIPGVLMHAPSSIVFISPIFHYGIGWLGGTIGINVALYPVLDPLPNLFIIKNFRNAILNTCCKKKVIPTSDF